jgi:hypothetical protein
LRAVEVDAFFGRGQGSFWVALLRGQDDREDREGIDQCGCGWAAARDRDRFLGIVHRLPLIDHTFGQREDAEHVRQPSAVVGSSCLFNCGSTD